MDLCHDDFAGHKCPACGQTVPEIDGILLDKSVCTVHYNGRDLRLTPKEFSVFEALVYARGRPVSKNFIMDWLYGMEGDDPVWRIVEVYIHKIRKKALVAKIDLIIETIWGRGYRIKKVGAYIEGQGH